MLCLLKRLLAAGAGIFTTKHVACSAACRLFVLLCVVQCAPGVSERVSPKSQSATPGRGAPKSGCRLPPRGKAALSALVIAGPRAVRYESRYALRFAQAVERRPERDAENAGCDHAAGRAQVGHRQGAQLTDDVLALCREQRRRRRVEGQRLSVDRVGEASRPKCVSSLLDERPKRHIGDE